MEPSVAAHMDDIRRLFRQYGVERAYLFGSAAKGSMRPDSDVDFLFSFPEDMDYVTYADNYFALAHALEKVLDRKVELVAERTLKNRYLIEDVEESKVRVL